MKEKYLSYTPEQVRESQLLTPERMAEVESRVEELIKPVYFDGTKEVPHAKFVDHGDGTGWLHPRVDEDHQWSYARRTAMAHVLTDEEFDLINKHCLYAQSERREAEQFEKAEKVTEWDGGVFVGDDFHSSLGEAMDMLDCDGDGLPAYLWTAEPHAVIPGLDVSEVVENSLASYGWEDMEASDLNGTKELQSALDKFVEANKEIVCFRPNYKKALVLEPTPPEKEEK